mmetsp:Transcript_31537/g.54644  ORF Transcript_31537/g.54644 Transcript_31537/m.54644 type:complete len:200 (+) Transcript_31537:35-634(+)
MALNFLPADYELKEELLADLRSSASLPDESLFEVFKQSINYLENPALQPADFMRAVSKSELSPEDLEKSARSVLLLLKFAASRYLTSQKLADDCSAIGMSPRLTSAIKQLWDKERHLILQKTLAQSLTGSELLDLEWKFGITGGSQVIPGGGQCFVQLKLTTQGASGEQGRVDFELNVRQFYQLLAELEKLKTVVEVNS